MSSYAKMSDASKKWVIFKITYEVRPFFSQEYVTVQSIMEDMTAKSHIHEDRCCVCVGGREGGRIH